MFFKEAAITQIRSEAVEAWLKKHYQDSSLSGWIDKPLGDIGSLLDLTDVRLTYYVKDSMHSLTLTTRHIGSGDIVRFTIHDDAAKEAVNFWLGDYLDRSLPLGRTSLCTSLKVDVVLCSEDLVSFNLEFEQQNFKSSLLSCFVKELKRFTAAFKESRTAVTKSNTSVYGKYRYAHDSIDPGNNTRIVIEAKGTIDELRNALK